MSESKAGAVNLKCPTCDHTITYDPNDPIYYDTGAMLRKPRGASGTTVVYLTCDQGHVHRYTVAM